ncbi:hypothetical protein [Methylobacterium sp. 1030]|uniref:hypothetical protein n=1 Tax=Methylobacterium sp. 1030 TaxID=3156404 RepID=UPI003390A8B3
MSSRYCSPVFSFHGGLLPYNHEHEYLDPRWHRKKAKILQRDGRQCRIEGCGETVALEVHHIRYLPIHVWDYPDKLLLTVCGYHHNRLTRQQRAERGRKAVRARRAIMRNTARAYTRKKSLRRRR